MAECLISQSYISESTNSLKLINTHNIDYSNNYMTMTRGINKFSSIPTDRGGLFRLRDFKLVWDGNNRRGPTGNIHSSQLILGLVNNSDQFVSLETVDGDFYFGYNYRGNLSFKNQNFCNGVLTILWIAIGLEKTSVSGDNETTIKFTGFVDEYSIE